MTTQGVINLAQKLSLFTDHWGPRTVLRLNDYEIKVVKLLGEFVWHTHHDTDEFFLVLKGRVRIELADGSVDLAAGDAFVVPRGAAHRPVASCEAEVMLIEPRGVVNTGEAGGPLTAPRRTL